MGEAHDKERALELIGQLDLDDVSGEELDPNEMARLAAGSTDSSTRSAILAKLGGTDAAVAATIAQEHVSRQGTQPARSRLWITVSIAASIVATVGAWWFLSQQQVNPLGDSDLARAFASMRAAEPELLAELTPVLQPERTAAMNSVERGGLRVIEPRAAVRDTHPAISWQEVKGANEYLVEVTSDEGESLLRQVASQPPVRWPQGSDGLSPGSAYVVRVGTTVAGLRVEGGSSFRVPSPGDESRFRKTLAAVEFHVPSALLPVARAHVALRFDLLHEAREYLEVDIDSSARQLADETRSYVERRLESD